MAKNTVTLALNGEVPFDEYTDAISHFRTLVNALSAELGVGDMVEWFIHDLQAGSATVTIRGESEKPEETERVIDAYTNVAKALLGGNPPAYGTPVVRAAAGITRILNSRITSIRFETADVDIVITSTPTITTTETVRTAIGTVEGRVQTLTERKSLRFTLYDGLHDRAVSCYVREDQREVMPDWWGKRAIVEGEVSREIESGRPIAVRKITRVQTLSEVERGSYLAARAVAPMRPGSPLPEEVIRRLRDA
jgi:hypothetical protein